MEGVFENSYVNIEDAQITREHQTIIECLCHYAETKPDEEAVVFASTEGDQQSVTWSEWYTKSKTVAKAFIHHGLKKQEIVAVNLQSCPEWLYATFGAAMAGGIPVGIVFTYTDGSDVIALMERLQKCSFLVMDSGPNNTNWDIITKLLDECHNDGTVNSQKMPYLRRLFGHEFSDEVYSTSVKRFVDLLGEEHPEIKLPDIRADDILCLFQTSGSTGVPKPVIYTHDMVTRVVDANIVKEFNQKYVLFNDRPFTWGGGFPFSAVTGQKRVTISGYCKQPDDRVSFIIEVIERERCSVIFALPPLMHELIKRQSDLPSDWPVEQILVAGQPITGGLAECLSKTCKRFTSVYGGTEFICLTQCLVSDPQKFTEYSCGKALKISGMEIKIVDDNEQTVPVNMRGEIYVRSPHIFKGYFNDPAKTKSAFTEDGWFKTDDIGRMTETGEFFVEGRISNMIISGGFNVAPEILEKAMKHIPGIATAIVVPVPDEVYHQVLCACVVKKEGSDINEEDVRKYCEDYNADKPGQFTVLPKFYIFFDRFPETSSGKHNRRELERIALQRFGTKST